MRRAADVWAVTMPLGTRTHLARLDRGKTLCGQRFQLGVDTIRRIRPGDRDVPFDDECVTCEMLAYVDKQSHICMMRA